MVETKEAEVLTKIKEPEIEEVNPRLEGLSFMLDDGTRKSHSLAENTAFVTGFFKGLSNRIAYRTLITSLYFVYKAMEEAFDVTADENVKSVDDPELRRLAAIEKDMDFFYGGDWKSIIKPSLATKSYVARINEIAEKEPHLLVAHQYTRYLGDLFGGQMMGGMATRSLELEKGEGVAFYLFDDIPNTNAFITEWYRRLNQLDLTEKEKKSIVDEGNFVFALNIGLFEELEGSPFKAMWTVAVGSLRQKLGLMSS